MSVLTAPQTLSIESIRSRLVAPTVARQLYLFGQVSSTNAALKRLAVSGAAEGTVVLAETQTAGRGRMGQPWFSPPGVNLYASVLFPHGLGGGGAAAGPAARTGRHLSIHRQGKEHHMKVRELMTGGLITVRPDTPVFDARQTMLKERIRHLLVTENRRLLGIVTDRDIRLNLPSQATSLSVWEVNYLLARLTVDKVMTTSVIIIGPDQEARDAARLMLEHKIGALPVLDGDHLIGIITETDVLRAFARRPEPAGRT